MEHKQTVTSFTTQESKAFHLKQLELRLPNESEDKLEKELNQGIKKLDSAIKQGFAQDFANDPISANQITRALDDYPAGAYLPERLWKHLQIDNFKHAIATGEIEEWFYQQCQYSYDFLFDKEGNFTEEAFKHIPQLTLILPTIKNNKTVEAFKRDFFIAVTVNPMINHLSTPLFEEAYPKREEQKKTEKKVVGELEKEKLNVLKKQHEQKNYTALMNIQTKVGELRKRFTMQDTTLPFHQQFEQFKQEMQTTDFSIRDKWLIAIEKLQLLIDKLDKIAINASVTSSENISCSDGNSSVGINTSLTTQYSELKSETILTIKLKDSVEETEKAIQKHLAKKTCFPQTDIDCQREFDAFTRKAETLTTQNNQTNKSGMLAWFNPSKKPVLTTAETALHQTVQEIIKEQKNHTIQKSSSTVKHG